MDTSLTKRSWPVMVAAGILLASVPLPGRAAILGVNGSSFTLTAKADTISTSDGDSMWMWGYALGSARMQYPGPTLIVNEGDMVTVTLNSQLPVPVSIVFPGQAVTASGGSAGLLTQEVATGQSTGAVTYRFRASNPGTYTYYSGTRPDLEVEMGLVGALIVRPRVGGSVRTNRAYDDPSTAFDREFLYLVSEADPVIHTAVAFHCFSVGACDLSSIDMTKRHPTDWFVNGRNFPDTMADADLDVYPTQPYNAMPMFHPGDRVLIRWVAGGLDLHPFHTHGQNHLIIARDGQPLATATSTMSDLAVSDYTTTLVPGETVDALWGPWNGARLGWDVYGTTAINPHTCNAGAGGFDPFTNEYCPDHNKPIPVNLPSDSELSFGAGGAGMWSGSPYLGGAGSIPPVNPGSFSEGNTMGGFTFMWHSHAERELTTNNIFPGGMATMALIVPAGTTIP